MPRPTGQVSPLCAALAALPELPFPAGSFDAIAGNFVLNHVGDPAGTFTELRRVARPGGRIAVTVWPSPPGEAQQLWGRVFEAAGVPRPADLPRLAAHREFPRTPDGLAGLLRRSGLTAVRCATLTWTHRTDPEAWWSGPAHGLGTPGIILRRQDAGTIATIRRHYDELTAPYRTPGGKLALPATALLATGSAP